VLTITDRQASERLTIGSRMEFQAKHRIQGPAMRRSRAAEGSKSETATVGRRHWQLNPHQKTKAAKPRPTAAPTPASLLPAPRRASAPEAGRAELEAEADAEADRADEREAADDEATADLADEADALTEPAAEEALTARDEAEAATAWVVGTTAEETAARLTRDKEQVQERSALIIG